MTGPYETERETRAVVAHIYDAAHASSRRGVRPDGKVTRELAARRSLRLRPIVAIFDEVQKLARCTRSSAARPLMTPRT
jgi:hypothetical protein